MIPNDRAVLGGKELDIYLPDRKIAFEVDGLYWHSELRGGPKHHLLHKTQFAYKEGVTVYHIFENEWNLKQDIVKSRIKAILGYSEHRIGARKCEIKTIESSVKDQFLEKNHLQGSDKSSLRFGAFYQGKLMAVMTFTKPSMSKGSKNTSGQYELNRFAVKQNWSISGIASRLLKFAIASIEETSFEIFSYSNRRWSNGDVYKQLGFEYVSATPPSYWYTHDYLDLLHRSNFMRHKLGVDSDETEWEIMQQRGYDRIWDCGNFKWNLSVKKH